MLTEEIDNELLERIRCAAGFITNEGAIKCCVVAQQYANEKMQKYLDAWERGEKRIQELEERVNHLEEGYKEALAEYKEFGIPQMAFSTLKQYLNKRS